MPELLFKGKEFVYNHHLTVPYRPLEMDASKSIGKPSLNGNLIIHGDNLHALKALLPMYAAKVDCIFIDPPYNTGNEGWNYNDNVNSPMMKEWLSSNPVNAEDMLRHDKWCAMMYPRLKLLHELLSDEGIFWMTLDDNEVSHARCVLDEIFGEENFIGQLIWKSRKSEDTRALSGISTDHEYVLSYAKLEGFRLEGVGINEAKFSNPDEDERGPWRSADMTGLASREQRPNLHYPIKDPETGRSYPPADRGWRFEAPVMKRKIEEKRILWPAEKSGRPRQKLFLKELKRSTKNVSSVIDFVSTGEGSSEVDAIFGKRVFDFPKPSSLVRFLVEQTTRPDSLILDSFAGSGTTGHAVLAANATDRGSRRFILVEGEEYADELTAERVRRAIKGYRFEGTQREELLRGPVTFTSLKNPEKLMKQVEGIENLEEHRFDSIKKEVKDGELVVTGERKVTKKTEGLGGEFTYCTLGEPLDLDKILTGKKLPDYESIGAWLYHTATGEALTTSKVRKGEWYLGESAAYHVWLVYKPELDFLKSSQAALTLELAEKIAKGPERSKSGKRHLVFAPAKYVPNKTLLPMGVEYAPLPFALYRVEKD
jgi:adenine-specific DNA-methyltransferase